MSFRSSESFDSLVDSKKPKNDLFGTLLSGQIPYERWAERILSILAETESNKDVSLDILPCDDLSPHLEARASSRPQFQDSAKLLKPEHFDLNLNSNNNNHNNNNNYNATNRSSITTTQPQSITINPELVNFISTLFVTFPISTALKCVSWCLSGGEEPTLFFEKKKKTAQEIVCSQVWNDGYYFYRCRDCGESPSSSICSDCFKSGDHQGHDWIFEVSVYGGCCDCGNVASWKSSGNCSRHSGQFPENPLSNLKPNEQTLLWSVITGLLHQAFDLMNLSSQDKLVSLIAFLRFLIAQHEMYLYAINRQFIYYQPNSEPFSKILARNIVHFSGKLLSDTLLLYLDLLQEPWFKEAFVGIYISIYSQLRDHVFRDDTHLETIYKLSPQLFSLPNLIEPFCTRPDGGLVKILISNLRQLFEKLSLKDEIFPNRLVVDANHSFIQRHSYYAFSNDLTSLLVTNSIAHYIVKEAPSCLEEFFELLQIFEFLDPTVRREDTHVEYESKGWKGAFSIGVELIRSTEYLAKGIQLFDDSPESFKCLQRLLSIALKYLTSWFETWLSANHMMPYMAHALDNPVYYPVYNVLTQPISFHLPTHRAFAKFLIYIVRKFPDCPLTELIPLDSKWKGYESLFMELPLQIQVVESQVKLWMWIRNGHDLFSQATIYKNTYFLDIHMCDILMIQLGIVLNPDLAFYQMYLRYGFQDLPVFQPNNRLKGTENRSPTDLDLKRAEAFLRLLIHLITSRSFIGVQDDPQTKIRRDVIHCLATQNCTRSQLIEELSQTYQEPKNLDEALEEVAQFRPPTASSPGVYSLKPMYWAEFDPFYHYYNLQSLEKAIENYASHKPKVAKILPLEPAIASFKTITDLLHVPRLIDSLCSVILTVVQTEAQSYLPILPACLHLLLMHLEIPPISSSVSASLYKNQSFVSDIILLHKNEKFNEIHDYTESILLKLCQNFETQILKALPNLINKAEKTQPQTEWELKRQRAKERQQKLIKQFATKQSQFLEENKEKKSALIDDFEDISHGELCAYCRSESEAQLGLITFVVASDIPRISQEQDNGIHYTLPENEITTESLNGFLSKQEAEDPVISSSPNRTFIFEDPLEYPLSPDFDPQANDALFVDENPNAEINNLHESSNTHPHSNTPQDNNRTQNSENFQNNNNIQNNHEKKEQEFQYQRLFSNPNQKTGVLYHSCGHVLHDDCFEAFLLSYQHKPQIFTYDPINSAEGEFPCPVCRRVSNAFTPLTKKTKLSPESSSENEQLSPSVSINKNPSPREYNNYGQLQTDQDEKLLTFLNILALTSEQITTTLQNSPSPLSRTEGLLKMFKNLQTSLSSLGTAVSHSFSSFSGLHMSSFNYLNSLQTNWLQRRISSPLREELAEPSVEKSPRNSFKRNMDRLYDRIVMSLNPHLQSSLPASVTSSQSIPVFWNSIMSALAHIEIPLRYGPLSQTTEQFEYLKHLTHAIEGYAKEFYTETASDRPFDIASLISSLFGIRNSSILPLLSNDLFGFYVRWSFVWMGETIFQKYNPTFLEILLIAHIMQIFVRKCHANHTVKIYSKEPCINVFKAAADHLKFSGVITTEIPSDATISLAAIQPSLMCFLRRVLLFNMLAERVPTDFDLPVTVDGLLERLQMPPLESIFHDKNNCYPRLIHLWCDQIKQDETIPLDIPPVAPIQKTQLITLTDTFQELIMKYVRQPCKKCNTIPKQPALCLLCGAVLCVASPCCENKNRERETYLHTLQCGCNVFLLLKVTVVLVVQGHRRSSGFGSFYLDRFSEEDVNLRRGRSLFLNPGLYRQLTHLWLSQSLFHNSKIFESATGDGKQL